MKKYFIEAYIEIIVQSTKRLTDEIVKYAVLLDLNSPKYNTKTGLMEYKILDFRDHKEPVFKKRFEEDTKQHDGFMPIMKLLNHDFTKCEIVEFKSDKEAKLWFRSNYK